VGVLQYFTAKGKFDGQKTIIWDPVKRVDAEGNSVKINFSWKEDKVSVVANIITLSGPYGAFGLESISSEFPEACR
jgi:hypothetical protein